MKIRFNENQLMKFDELKIRTNNLKKKSIRFYAFKFFKINKFYQRIVKT